MLGPQDYHTKDAIVLIRPIAENVTLKAFAGSHHMTKSEFKKSQHKSTTVQARRIEEIEARTTLWTEWEVSSGWDELLFAVVVFTNGPADVPDAGEDFPGRVEEGDVAPFLRY
jgi:hypothetical protein